MGSHVNARPRVPSTHTRKILDDLRRIVRVLRVLSVSVESRHGVTAAQLFALEALGRHPGASLRDLSQATHTDQSSVSTLVKRLEARGLVLRRPGRTDGRSVELTLSPKGKALLRKAPEAPQARLVRGVEGLSPTTRRDVSRSLRALVRAMGADQEEPSLFFEGSPLEPGRPRVNSPSPKKPRRTR